MPFRSNLKNGVQNWLRLSVAFVPAATSLWLSVSATGLSVVVPPVGALTVMAAALELTFEPSVEWATTEALPAATPVTKPLEFTVATLGLLEVQVTVLFVAFAGETVAVSVVVAPAAIVAEPGATLMLLTRI